MRTDQVFGSGCIQVEIAAKDGVHCPSLTGRAFLWVIPPPDPAVERAFYRIWGRKRAKLIWPLVVVNMTLSASFEALVMGSLRLGLKFHFIALPGTSNPRWGLSSTVPNVFWHAYPPSAELQGVLRLGHDAKTGVNYIFLSFFLPQQYLSSPTFSFATTRTVQIDSKTYRHGLFA